MIVFTDKIELVQVLSQVHPGRQIIIMNLSSYKSGYYDITPLITNISPINNTQMPAYEFVDSISFDMQYAAALENNFTMYQCMMQMVVRSYEGYIVVVLVYRDPYRDAIMESLIKYIQQKYGHNCWVVEDVDDLMYIKDESFTPMGIKYVDDDITRYNDLYSKGQVPALLEPINME